MIDETKLIDEVNDLMDANLLFYDDASKSRQETLDEILDLIDEQQRVGEWIPVEERLPESCEYVLVSCVNGAVEYGAYYAGDKDWSLISTDWQCKVLAWQPLPKPYEVKENE